MLLGKTKKDKEPRESTTFGGMIKKKAEFSFYNNHHGFDIVCTVPTFNIYIKILFINHADYFVYLILQLTAYLYTLYYI